MSEIIYVTPTTTVVNDITLEPVSSTPSTITIEHPSGVISTFNVTEDVEEVRVLTIGVPGPAGETVAIPESITAVASTILGGHRVVQIFNNIASYANNINAYDGQLGLTMGAIEAGATFKAYTTGVVTEPSWNFVKGSVFLGNNGLLTQTMPVTGTVVLVGKAISNKSIALGFQQLYKRG